jgi:hypothetical protein
MTMAQALAESASRASGLVRWPKLARRDREDGAPIEARAKSSPFRPRETGASKAKVSLRGADFEFCHM